MKTIADMRTARSTWLGPFHLQLQFTMVFDNLYHGSIDPHAGAAVGLDAQCYLNPPRLRHGGPILAQALLELSRISFGLTKGLHDKKQ